MILYFIKKINPDIFLQFLNLIPKVKNILNAVDAQFGRTLCPTSKETKFNISLTPSQLNYTKLKIYLNTVDAQFGRTLCPACKETKFNIFLTLSQLNYTKL